MKTVTLIVEMEDSDVIDMLNNNRLDLYLKTEKWSDEQITFDKIKVLDWDVEDE